ncbi:MAG: hypothetical protein L3J04_02605 [Robiginitomaculum sp.]|nr:hypothetical protein [Robiginitomaculum sp.]
MFRFIFLITSFLILSISGPAFATAEQAFYQPFPEPNISEPPETITAEPIATLRIQHFSLGRSGYLTVALRGNKVIDAQYMKQENASLELRKKTETWSRIQSFPTSQVVLDNETIMIVQLTFADGTTVFVIIHKATGTTTIVQQ